MKNWVIVLAIVGLIISLFLIPSKEETAHIELKGHKYQEASNYYQEQYDAGDRTPDTIIHLSELKNRMGDLPGAIAVMKEYLHQHPDDYFARQKLAEYYLEDQQYPEYYQTLLQLPEKIKTTNQEVIQELINWYRQENQIEPLMLSLQSLIQIGKASSDDYYELAYLYAAQNEYQKTLTLLQQRTELFHEKQTIFSLFLEVWASVQLAKQEKNSSDEISSIHKLAEYLLKENNVNLTSYAIGTFREQYPQLAPLLIEELQPIIQKSPYLQAIALQTLWEIPAERKNAYLKLLDIYKHSSQNALLQNFAFEVFLEKDNDSLLIDLIHNSSPQNLQERNLFNFAYLTFIRNKPELAKLLQDSLGQAYLEKHPSLAAAFRIAAREKDSQIALRQLIKEHTLSRTESYSLLLIAAAAKFEKEALQLGEQLVPYAGMTQIQLVDVALAYSQIKKTEVLYPLFEKALPLLGEITLRPALSILDISKHQTLQVAKWLQTQQALNESTWEAFYITAEENQEYPLALYIAKRQFSAYPTAQAEANYGLALVQVGKVDQGVLILKELFHQSPTNPLLQSMYFTALSEAVKKNPIYQHDLVSYMHLREKQGDLPSDLLRNFGYIYIEILRDYTKAAEIFFTLADSHSPEKADEETLVYLWGPKISAEKKRWLQVKAAHATAKDLDFWLQSLIFTGQYDSVISIFEKHLSFDCDSIGIKAYFAYMDALEEKKLFCRLNEMIDYLLPRIKAKVDLETCNIAKVKQELEKLSAFAESSEYFERRQTIRELMVSKWPNDPINWQKLGRAAFDAHDYKTAGYALQTLFCFCKHLPNFYESLYEYAEVLLKYEYYDCAKNYYAKTIEEINEITETPINPRALEIKGLSLDKLGFSALGREEIGKFYETTSFDPDAKAAYANLLIDAGLLKQAKQFLRCHHAP